MSKFKTNVAVKYGIKAAIVAQLIWDEIERTSTSYSEQLFRNNRYWCKYSMLMMSVKAPYLSRHMFKDAVAVLVKCKVLKKDHFSENKFDHTNWYAFTDYGMKIMKGDDKNEESSV